VPRDEPIYEELHDQLPEWARSLTRAVNRLTKEIHAMSDDQNHLDADVQALVSGLDAVEAEIAALKNQPAADALDFTGVDAVVARLQADVPPAPAA
jgi:chromosome segregation ATPase